MSMPRELKNGLTPLCLAQQGRLAEIESILFQHGADFDAHDNMNKNSILRSINIAVKRSSWGAKVVEIIFALDKL
jgi:hypothetical protein